MCIQLQRTKQANPEANISQRKKIKSSLPCKFKLLKSIELRQQAPNLSCIISTKRKHSDDHSVNAFIIMQLVEKALIAWQTMVCYYIYERDFPTSDTFSRFISC